MIDFAKAVKDLVDGQVKFYDWNKRDDIKSALKALSRQKISRKTEGK